MASCVSDIIVAHVTRVFLELCTGISARKPCDIQLIFEMNKISIQLDNVLSTDTV